MRDLLEAPEQRPKVFYRGYDIYDQVKVGFVSEGEEVQRIGTRHFERFQRNLAPVAQRGVVEPKDDLALANRLVGLDRKRLHDAIHGCRNGLRLEGDDFRRREHTLAHWNEERE